MLLPKLPAFDTVPPVPYSIDISPETYENNNDNMNTEENDHLGDDRNNKESEMKNRSIYDFIIFFFLLICYILD